MTASVCALFVDESPAGIYPRLLGADACYGESRDARTYAGPHSVVAHPPCNLWVNMAAQNYARATRPCPSCIDRPGEVWSTSVPVCGKWETCPDCNGTGRREPNRAVVLPAWYPGGDDGGCFASALASVRRFGGVLEHPAGSHAWERLHRGLNRPVYEGWNYVSEGSVDPHKTSWFGCDYAVCEVWQSAYGHLARKRTWLLYCGARPPFELRWARTPGTHQVGWFDRIKPTVGKREASATPEEFARELIRLAEWSRE